MLEDKIDNRENKAWLYDIQNLWNDRIKIFWRQRENEDKTSCQPIFRIKITLRLFKDYNNILRKSKDSSTFFPKRVPEHR